MKKNRKATAVKDGSSKSTVRIVAQCEEFTLFSDGRVRSSQNVEIALLRSCFSINNSKGSDQRLELAIALWQLMEFRVGHFLGDTEDLLESLAATLGTCLLDGLNIVTPPAWKPNNAYLVDDVVSGGTGTYLLCKIAHTSETKFEMIDRSNWTLHDGTDSAFFEKRGRRSTKRLKTAVHKIETAYSNLATYRSKRPMPGTKSPGAWTWIIQVTAKQIFRQTKERPRKAEIREELEQEGWGFAGHDQEENWMKKFVQAGLGNLPK